MDDKLTDRDVLELETAKTDDPSASPAVQSQTDAAPPRHPKALDDADLPKSGSSLSPEVIEQMTADIVAAIKTVYDPEIPADIYELGPDLPDRYG